MFYTHQENGSRSFCSLPPNLPGCLLVSVETGRATGIAARYVATPACEPASNHPTDVNTWMELWGNNRGNHQP